MARGFCRVSILLIGVGLLALLPIVIEHCSGCPRRIRKRGCKKSSSNIGADQMLEGTGVTILIINCRFWDSYCRPEL